VITIWMPWSLAAGEGVAVVAVGGGFDGGLQLAAAGPLYQGREPGHRTPGRVGGQSAEPIFPEDRTVTGPDKRQLF
jgi:hypothetical protein